MTAITNTRAQITSLTQDLAQVQAQMGKEQQQIATGHSFNTPAGNPSGAVSMLRLNALLAQNQADLGSVQDGTGWLQNAQSSLKSLQGILKQTQALAIQAQSTTNATTRQQISLEVGVLAGEAMNVLNSKYQNQYLFAGTQSGTQPFAQGASGAFSHENTALGLSGSLSFSVGGQTTTVNVSSTQTLSQIATAITQSVPGLVASVSEANNITGYQLNLTSQHGGTITINPTTLANTMGLQAFSGAQYQGNDIAQTRVVSSWSQNAIPVSIPGSALIGQNTPGWLTTPGANPINAMLQLQQDLVSNPQNIQTDLSNIQTAMSQTVNLEGQVGSTINALSATKTQLQTANTSLQNLGNQTQNVDVAQTMMNYKTNQNLYQTELKLGSQLPQQNLFNFLG